MSDILIFGDLNGEETDDTCAYITSARDRESIGVAVLPHEDKKLSIRLRGLFAHNARTIFANSNRTYIIASVLLPKMVRLLRFDTSGVIFSELFQWKTTLYLARVFQRMAAASPAERGIDPSVKQHSNDHQVIMDAKAIFDKALLLDQLPSGVTWGTIFPEPHVPSSGTF